MPPERVAEAVLDLIDLAIRHLSVEERGETTLAVHDERVLSKVVEALERHRHAVAMPNKGRRPKLLSPEQAALGYLRIDFDHLCRVAAARTKFTRDRDNTLEELLWRACEREGRHLNITREHVRLAISAVREPILKQLEAEGSDDDWLVPSPWDENTEKQQWQTTAVTAGRLLRHVLAQASPAPTTCAESTTAEYARRVRVADPAVAARSVSQEQRLIYLAMALGAAPSDALRVASQLHDLLSAKTTRDGGGLAATLVGILGRTEWANSVVPEGSGWAPPENPWEKAGENKKP